MNTTPNDSANASTAGHDSSHVNIVESLLPLIGLRGFAPVYGFIGSWLGWDPTFVLGAIGIMWAVNKLLRQVYHLVYGLVTEYLMSSIHISSTDDIYLHLMKWLASQPRMVNSRALTAETVSKTAWEDEDESNVARDLSGMYLNFSNQEARAPPQYVPAMGLHNFWWGGQYFRLHRKKESVFDDGGSGGWASLKDKEDLVLSCLWRSPEPIKKLLAHAKQQYYSDHQARTIVKRPSPQGLRRYGGRYNWQQVANRPVRDMRTVVLDQQQKLQVLADINEYLHPETPRWYANRGIPLRRGYLFHGPPGTGKTSLSFALAGVFGLDIHVISLLEPTLTEEDLSSLFNSLPRRCVVLLEDIDTAGLKRPAEELDPADKGKSDAGKDESVKDWKVSDLAKALKKEGDDQKKGISLSGLLNAIDGVASHEGRVLIMTTNVPESLDNALIRPGRVDLQVGFTNATKQQAQELFIRMYEGHQERPKHQKAADAASGTTHNGSAVGTHEKKEATPTANGSGENQTKPAELDVPVAELPEVARKFGDKIPDGEFSPAEIQGYLLKRKKHPLRALDEADKWVEALEYQRELEQAAQKATRPYLDNNQTSRSSAETVFAGVDAGESAFVKNDRPGARSPAREELKRKE
ncbi:BCS1 N terminal-domain-containing protein [Xylariomycetidae sp. FL2044]|nr:BCS1 N terminal-domain-containing protein [Xylariomycetidae sp. FL2044]